jgi:predicted dehydrogenase
MAACIHVCIVSAAAASARVVRFGLIGAGQQGRQLARAVRSVRGARLVACSDPDLLARATVPGADLARCADFRALLDRSDLDAVVVATPHHILPLVAQAAADRAATSSARSPWRPRQGLPAMS